MNLLKPLTRHHFTLFEIIWLTCTLGASIWVTLATGDNLLGFIATAAGIFFVLCTARGSYWAFPFGFVNALTYANIAFQNGLFGEVSLNLLFYLPVNFISFFLWRKHTHGEEGLDMRKLTWKQMTLVAVILAALSVGFGFILQMIPGQNTPFIDSTTNVLSIASSLFMMARFREQFSVYIVLDTLSTVMWVLRLFAGSADALAMVVMWIAYTANAFYGYYVWTKGASK